MKTQYRGAQGTYAHTQGSPLVQFVWILPTGARKVHTRVQCKRAHKHTQILMRNACAGRPTHNFSAAVHFESTLVLSTPTARIMRARVYEGVQKHTPELRERVPLRESEKTS